MREGSWRRRLWLGHLGPLSLKCLECQDSPNPRDNDVSYSAVSTKRAEMTALAGDWRAGKKRSGAEWRGFPAEDRFMISDSRESE